MENSWGKEAMKFARTEIPALLNGYQGKPEGFFSALDERWKKRCEMLKERLEELKQDDDPEGTADAAAAAERSAEAERVEHEAKVKAKAAKDKAAKAKADKAAKSSGGISPPPRSRSSRCPAR